MLFSLFGAVLGSPFFSVLDTDGIKSTAHDMVTHTGKVLDAPPPDQYDRVLLKIVPDTGDISNHFNAGGQPDLCYFSKSRVWFFWSLRFNL